MADQLQMTFAERAEGAKSAMARRTFELMSQKETNVCLSLDETDPERFLNLAAQLGPEIAVLKTHIDTLENFSSKIVVELTSLAHEHNFLIFEDRKFADIGQTVKNQYTKGIFHIIEWADIVNAHAISGPGIIQGIRDEVNEYDLTDQRGMLLLAQMSTKGNLFSDEYTKEVVSIAKANSEFVMGFIGAGEKLKVLASISEPGFIIFVPGVKLAGEGDNFDQSYNTPEKTISNGGDIVVVGRGIIEDSKPLARAREYRKVCWDTLERRIAEPKVRRRSK